MDQEKQKWLGRYLIKRRRIDCLRERVQELDLRIQTPGSPPLDGLPKVKNNSSIIENLLIKKVELEERISVLDMEARQYKLELIEAVDGMEDPILAEIIESHYIDNESINSIAERLNYSNRHVFRLYSKAVNEIQIPGGGG